VGTEGLSPQLNWPRRIAFYRYLVPKLKTSGVRRATKMGAAGLQPPKKKFKKTLFETGFQWFLRDLTFSLKLADN